MSVGFREQLSLACFAHYSRPPPGRAAAGLHILQSSYPI